MYNDMASNIGTDSGSSVQAELDARPTSIMLASTSAGRGAGMVGYKTSDAGATDRTLAEKLGEISSIKDFGAKGDGVTNDTVAVRSALLARAGNVIFFPKGIYELDGNLAVLSNTTIHGAGSNHTVIRLRNNSNVSGFTANSMSGITFRDLTLDGNKANNAASPAGTSGIRTDGACTDVLFERVHFKDWMQNGASIVGDDGAARARAIDCRGSGCGVDGIVIEKTPFSCILGGEYMNNGRYGFIFANLSNHSKATGVYSHDNGESGGTAVGPLVDIIITHCHLSNNAEYGFNGVGTDDLRLEGITAIGNGVDGLGATLYPNHLGTELYSERPRFMFNNVRYNGRVGISVDSESHDAIVVGNDIRFNGWEGVNIFRSKRSRILFNNIFDNCRRNVLDADPDGWQHDAGIMIWDTAPSPNQVPSQHARIAFNNLGDTGDGHQKWGIKFDDVDGHSNDSIINDNVFSGHPLGSILTENSTNIKSSSGNFGYEKPTSEIILINGWKPYDVNWQEPSFFRRSDGVTFLSGVMKSGIETTGTVIGTLPVGYRPAKVAGPFLVYCDGTGLTSFYVLPNGDIKASGPLSAIRTSLCGISFNTS